jgi:membrane protein
MTKLERLIITSPPIAFLIRKSKQIVLPGFEGLPLYDVARFFFKQTQQVGLNERAAAISFNFLMAIPPLGIFLFTLLANLPESRDLYKVALSLARQITPNDSTYKIIRSIADDFFRPDRGLSYIGLITAVYFSSNAMITIMRTFNKSILHIETEKRNFFRLRWEAMRLTVLIVMLIVATIMILFTQSTLVSLLSHWLHVKAGAVNWLGQLLRLGITFGMVYFSVAFIYRYAPAVQKKWKISSPGALLATLIIIGFTYLFSYWVNNFASYNKVYGSIGSILILMLLVFINSLVMLIGFELNVSINSLRSIANRRELAN